MKNRFSRVAGILLVLLAIGVLPLSAQIQTQPITLGTEQPGAVTVTNIAPAFSFTVNAPVTINVRVQAVVVGFAPAFRVLDAAGLLVQDVGNPTAAGTVEASVVLPQAGSYIVQVQSANGAAGQFSLLVDAGETPPQPLVVDDDVEGEVSPAAAAVSYTFEADGDRDLQLSITSPLPSEARVRIANADGEEVANISLLFTEIALIIPGGSGEYTLDVEHSGGELVEPYTVLLSGIREEEEEEEQPEEPTQPPPPTPAPQQQIVLPNLPTSGACVVASSTAVRVNIRNRPSTDGTEIIAQMDFNQTATVTGRLDNSSWYRVNFNGVEGWISAEVTRRGGDCSSVPVVNPDGGSTAAPTNTPAPSGGDSGGTPDLSVNAVSLSPGTPVEDNNFSVNVTISNTGNGTANNVKVRLIIEASGMDVSAPNSETTISSIAAGASASYTFSDLQSEDTGDFDIRVRVDPDNAISESNEGNNDRTIDVTVSESRADLVVNGLDVDTDDGSTEVEVNVTARNDGTEESNNFNVRLRFDPAVIEDQFIAFDDLNPGESTTKSITVDLGSFDDYEVTATVDYDDGTEEIDEDNNSRTIDFDVQDD